MGTIREQPVNNARQMDIYICKSHYETLSASSSDFQNTRKHKSFQTIQKSKNTQYLQLNSSDMSGYQEQCNYCDYEVVKCCCCGGLSHQFIRNPCNDCASGRTTPSWNGQDPRWIEFCEQCLRNGQYSQVQLHRR